MWPPWGTAPAARPVRALNRYRDALGMELPQDGANLVFRCWKRNARGLARRARLVATVFLELISEGLIVADMQNSPLANYSVCREMLPHRFVDVFETVSIIEDFYVRAIRRAAATSRRRCFLHISLCRQRSRNWRSKNVEVFLPPVTCDDANPSSIWSAFGQVVADTVGIDSQNR